MITLYDFLELYTTDDEIDIYDLASEAVVFRGYKDEVDEMIHDCEVMSFDVEANRKLIVNIDMDEME